MNWNVAIRRMSILQVILQKNHRSARVQRVNQGEPLPETLEAISNSASQARSSRTSPARLERVARSLSVAVSSRWSTAECEPGSKGERIKHLTDSANGLGGFTTFILASENTQGTSQSIPGCANPAAVPTSAVRRASAASAGRWSYSRSHRPRSRQYRASRAVAGPVVKERTSALRLTGVCESGHQNLARRDVIGVARQRWIQVPPESKCGQGPLHGAEARSAARVQSGHQRRLPSAPIQRRRIVLTCSSGKSARRLKVSSRSSKRRSSGRTLS